MTFSIVACDADGSSGVAVASKFLAAGAVVPAAAAGVGALASQAHANLRYRPEGLALLADGLSAHETVRRLTDADPDRDHRQLGVVDAHGDAASFTGTECMPWAGGRTGPGFSAQGNILTGPEVVDAMVDSWVASDPAAPLAERLHAALLAGDRAGGDSRGRQAAAVLVVRAGGGYGGSTDVVVDLRVDDHTDPVPELGRLLVIHERLFGRTDPHLLLPLEGDLLVQVGALLARAGHTPASSTTQAVERVLAQWAGIENLEDRLVAGRIDPVVLDHLSHCAGGAA